MGATPLPEKLRRGAAVERPVFRGASLGAVRHLLIVSGETTNCKVRVDSGFKSMPSAASVPNPKTEMISPPGIDTAPGEDIRVYT